MKSGGEEKLAITVLLEYGGIEAFRFPEAVGLGIDAEVSGGDHCDGGMAVGEVWGVRSAAEAVQTGDADFRAVRCGHDRASVGENAHPGYEMDVGREKQ